MPQLLRFQLYSDATRTSYSQIHPDIPVEGDPPHFKYGHPIRVGDDAQDRETWPEYRIAHFMKLKQEPNFSGEGKNLVVYEVYLAEESQWKGFGVPDELKGERV